MSKYTAIIIILLYPLYFTIAEEAHKISKTTITAENFDLFPSKASGVFYGNTMTSSDDIIIYSDKIHIKYHTANGKTTLQNLEYLGNVKLTRQGTEIKSDEAEYNSGNKQITFEYNVKISKDGNIAECDLLTYDSVSGNTHIHGSKEKVRVILQDDIINNRSLH